MRYQFCQYVTLVDMNEEILTEVLFEHGEFESPALSIGASVVSYQLGLKEFEVVYDKREGRTSRFKVVDLEIDLIKQPIVTRVYLEPQRLIIGQHDIGQYSV
ncbi:hypothetical protein D3C73_907000 [compost metagenome]